MVTSSISYAWTLSHMEQTKKCIDPNLDNSIQARVPHDPRINKAMSRQNMNKQLQNFNKHNFSNF